MLTSTNYTMQTFSEMYYLCYYVNACLFSVEKLKYFDCNHPFLSKFEYYHFFVDNILNYIGHISKLCLGKKGGNDIAKKIRFDKNLFPILSNRYPRNYNVHVNEKNSLAIAALNTISLFNVIFSDNDKELINLLNHKQKYYACILDLRNNSININGYDSKNGKLSEKIMINDLRKELNELKNRINNYKDN